MESFVGRYLTFEQSSAILFLFDGMQIHRLTTYILMWVCKFFLSY